MIRPDWPTFTLPPTIHDASGKDRTVGVEIEFSGLDVAQSTELVVELFGGSIATPHRFSRVIEGAEFGTWRAEIDSKLLTDEKYKPILEKLGVGETATHAVESALETVASTWIPCEIVTPPIPVTALGASERLREALLDRGATGTRASPVYLFGFQLNPAVPRVEADCILAHLRAFIALYGWLASRIDVDLTRRLTSVAAPFPEDYVARVLDPAYAPDLDGLVDDYLDASPGRERALDLLPLFAHVRPERVRERALEPDKVRARPTFHYRLPNSLVDDPAWSFALEWNRWVEVERLAADPKRLLRVAADVAAGSTKGSDDDWLERGRGWGVEAI